MNKRKKEEILLYILRFYQLHKGQKITYSFFKQIYQKVKEELTEDEFSKLLGIKPVENKELLEINPIIDKTDIYLEISEEEKEQILIKLIKDYDLYKGQEINVYLFEKMYESEGKKLTKEEFANLLGIKVKTYYAFREKHEKNKEKDIKVRILLNKNLTDKEKSKTVLELVQKYNLYKGKKISYTFFREMYNEIKSKLTEIEFANMLGIMKSNLRNIRNTKDEARIFRNMTLCMERKEQIRKNLLKNYEGKTIYYKKSRTNKGKVEFLKIYNPYRIYFTQTEFAEMLGISQKNLWYTKEEQANPKIKDIEKIAKVKELKEQIEEGRYYSKEEIEEKCIKIGLSIEDFIIYYINNANFFDASIYKQSIEKNKKIWIGKGRIPNIDIEKNIETLTRIINTVTNEINKRYGQKYLEEDLKSDMMLYIISNCVDLIKNFEYDTKVMERMIWTRTRKYAQITFIQEYKKDIKKVQLIEGRTRKEQELGER